MSTTKTAYKAFIGGEFVDSASGETMEMIAPAIAEVPRSLGRGCRPCRRGGEEDPPDWLDKTPKERSELLLKLADVIDDNVEELAQLEHAAFKID
jgi:acyl-CoA reductase-like NAD-dependent aldehyde dehydrogenase